MTHHDIRLCILFYTSYSSTKTQLYCSFVLKELYAYSESLWCSSCLAFHNFFYYQNSSFQIYSLKNSTHCCQRCGFFSVLATQLTQVGHASLEPLAPCCSEIAKQVTRCARNGTPPPPPIWLKSLGCIGKVLKCYKIQSEFVPRA